MTTHDLLPRLTQAIDELEVTALENPAVAKCTRLYMLLYAETLARGDSDSAAKSNACQAYRLAMPALIGQRNVRDFIACATHGVLLGAIPREEASSLLYAAQVAHTARRAKSKPQNTVPKPVSPANGRFPNQPSET